MPKYRLKQNEVEAYQFTDETKDRVLGSVREIQANIYPSWDDDKKPILLVPTLVSGNLVEEVCCFGDYLVKIQSPTDWRTIRVVKAEQFEKTYEAISMPSLDRELIGNGPIIIKEGTFGTCPECRSTEVSKYNFLWFSWGPKIGCINENCKRYIKS